MKFATIVAVAALAAASTDAARIHPSVHRALRQQGTVNVFVKFNEGTASVLSSIKESNFATRGQQIASVVEALELNAANSQKDVAALLVQEASTQLFTRMQRYWINNELYIENAKIELIEKLAAIPSVSAITEQEVYQLPDVSEATTLAVTNSTATEWGVTKINAKGVWATGNIGQNAVVGIIDSGARGTHTLLKGSYLNNGFSWFDPESRRAEPFDNNGHGTHVTGTIAGDNGIGVAPGAKWMMCRGCRGRNCFASDLLACFQFMTCPTNAAGTVKDCSKAPRVVSNSWGGSGGSTTFVSAVNTWSAAGIIPIFANGNAGPSCGSAGAPADRANVIAVGSTDKDESLAGTSSRGPSTTGLVKPDVSAPGVLVRSSWHTGDSAFNEISGTSMATPHVTGVVALMLSIKPDLTFAQAKAALTSTTVKTLKSAATCGGTPSTVFPNNQFGHGRVDAPAAVNFVKAL
jgi:subtilisin family serine protease